MSAHGAGQLLRALDDVLLVSACRSMTRLMGEVGKLGWLGSKQADGGGPVGLGAAGPGGEWGASCPLCWCMLRVLYAVESAMAHHSDNIESCTGLAHPQSKTTPYNTHTSLERTNNRNVDHRGQILDACRRALPLVGRCAAGPKVEPARHKHGQDRRPQEVAQGRGVVEAGAALKDVLPQQNQLARRIRMKKISSHCVYVFYCTCIDSYMHTLGSWRMNFLYNVSVHRKE
jgi:hypothetical protein